MFKLTILLIFCLNCYHCYKQPMSNNEYGGQSQPTISLPKPQAIIHLPENVYTHKITDTIKLDHEQLSNYLSSINYIPHTLHKHAQLLAQLDPADIQKYGQSINSNQLPLISLTVPSDSKNSEYNDAQIKIEEYPAAPQQQQQDYAPQQQSNSGYQQGGQDYNNQAAPQQQQQQQQSYGQEQQSYSPPQAPRKNCNQNKNSGDYGGQSNSQEEQYGNTGGYNNDVGSGENTGGYDNNKSPEVEYQQSPPMDNYDSGNYYTENNGGGSYENNQDGGNSYENNNNGNGGQENGGYSNNNNNQQDYGKSSNEGNEYNSENYESSPFDYNFVQEILRHVMNQLEQLQIDPDSLSAYGKVEEDSNQGGDNYNSGGNDNSYNSQGGRQGIQLVDRPDGQEVNYAYSLNHATSYEPQPQNNGGSNNYEPSYTSSSTTSQATSYNDPGIVLDNKIPVNENKDQSTVTYRMPTINLELPKPQIEHIMKAISEKKGGYAQPIMIKANSFKLPSNLNLGKIKTIAFIKSSKLGNLKELPYFNTQLLGSNINSLNNYKIVSSMSKNEEVKYDSNPVLSAYGYGVSLPSSKLYASSSNKKPSIILPLKSRSKRLGSSYSSLQAASSNLKSIISSLPKISKSKKASAKSSTATVIGKTK